MPPPESFAERDRLQRWLAAIGLTQAAEESARIDTPETNALALLGAHSACESLLGLLYGMRRYKRNEEVPLPKLVVEVDEKIGLNSDLADDLDAMHRMRNDFVHASSTVHANEAARAVSAARRLLDVVSTRSVPGLPLPAHGGVATAVAEILDVQAVGIWLRHADEMAAAGRIQLAADGCARALDEALTRTHPRLRRARISSRIGHRDLARVSAGVGYGGSFDREIAEFAEDLSAWVLPLALGLSPIAYERLRGIVGRTSSVDLRGKPAPVDRPSSPPAEADIRMAMATTSGIVFRLWATGSLRPTKFDDQVVELAQAFLADPSGYTAGDRGPAGT